MYALKRVLLSVFILTLALVHGTQVDPQLVCEVLFKSSQCPASCNATLQKLFGRLDRNNPLNSSENGVDYLVPELPPTILDCPDGLLQNDETCVQEFDFKLRQQDALSNSIWVNLTHLWRKFNVSLEFVGINRNSGFVRFRVKHRAPFLRPAQLNALFQCSNAHASLLNATFVGNLTNYTPTINHQSTPSKASPSVNKVKTVHRSLQDFVACTSLTSTTTIQNETGSEVYTRVICENHEAYVSCSGGRIISIIDAFYGRDNDKECLCNRPVEDTNCRAETSNITIKKACERHSTCFLQAKNSIFVEPCYGTYKYIKVIYSCVGGNNSEPTPTSSTSGNQTIDSYECLESSLHCGENARCESVAGDPECRCLSGFDGDPYVQCSAFCDPVDIHPFTFNRTWAGLPSFSNEACPDGSPQALVFCEYEAKERALFNPSNVLTRNCSETLDDFLSSVENGQQELNDLKVGEIASNLVLMTSRKSSVTLQDASRVAGFVEKVADRVKANMTVISKQVFGNVVNLASNIVVGPLSRSTYGNATATGEYKRLGSALSRSLSNMAMRYKLATDESRSSIETDAIFVHVQEQGIETKAFTLKPVLRSFRDSSYSNPVNVYVPESAVQLAWQQHDAPKALKSLQRAALILFKSDQLFKSDDNAQYVTSIEVGAGVTLKNLKDPIRIQHNHVKSSFSKSSVAGDQFKVNVSWLECRFWDYETESWSSSGCYLNKSATPVECLCNHLTNFAVLVRSELAPANVALSVVSNIGTAISIVAMLFTAFVIAISPDLRKHRSGKLLIQICCCLSVAYLTFLFGVSSHQDQAACTFAAVLLHYFLIASWCSMSVYSYDMYISLVKVFGSYRTKFMWKSAVFCFGLPALIVAVNVGIAIGYFDRRRSDMMKYQDYPIMESEYLAVNMCWITNYSLYVGFLAPVAIMLFYNCAVFVQVTVELNKQNREVQSELLRRTTKQSLLLATTMTVVMGITWVFGYVMLLSDNETFLSVTSWIFAIFCAFQGLGIFLLTTLRRSDMRKVWCGVLGRRYTASKSSPTNRRPTSEMPLSSPKTRRATTTNVTSENSTAKIN